MQISTIHLIFILFTAYNSVLRSNGRIFSNLSTEMKIFPGANDSTQLTMHQTWGTNVLSSNGTILLSRNRAIIAKNVNDTLESLANDHQPELFQSKEVPSNEWEYAVAYASANKWYFTGTMGRMFVWEPKVEPNEMSFSYISVGGLGVDGTGEYYIRVGWRVSPSEYGDGQPRFAVYRSGSNCFNNCSGFVQTNSNVDIDVPLGPVSVYGGKHYAIDVEIKRDNHLNWVVSVGNEVIGHYPHELFIPFSQGDTLYYGGAVTNKNPGGKHTHTEMGSGEFSSDSNEQTAFINGIFSYDLEGGVQDADQPLNYIITKPNCYDIRYLGQLSDGSNVISYGGPGGQNPNCS